MLGLGDEVEIRSKIGTEAELAQAVESHTADPAWKPPVTPEEKQQADKQAARRAAVKNLRDKPQPTMADAIPALKVWAEEWLTENGGT